MTAPVFVLCCGVSGMLRKHGENFCKFGAPPYPCIPIPYFCLYSWIVRDQNLLEKEA